MNAIKLSRGIPHHKNLIPSVSIEKIQDTGQNLNVIMSTGYAAIVNTATCFIFDYVEQLKKLPICRGLLKSYVNRIKSGMKKFDTSFKYDFTNLDIWKKNLDLTDYISGKIEPVCKSMYFAISNELGKTQPKDREMLANMIVGAILLHQATTLFDEILKKSRMETSYNYRPYFSHLSARCIEYPFGESFMIVANAYNIDAKHLTKIEHVRIGINTLINIMGDENTYREAKENIENDND